jgi:hypothetical protein
MSKKIIFKARSKAEFETQLKPIPAASVLPQWWRDLTPYSKGPENPDGKKLLVRNRNSNAGPKKCTPMLDGLTSGYIIPLWSDVFVSQGEDPNISPEITWRTYGNVFELHGSDAHELPHPPGYDRWVFKYMNCWIPQTPPGYSIMVTAPAGYRDAPFLPIPAVVDTDKSTLELVFPMWVKTGLTGVVEQGTPMVQLTPFKRDNWQSEFEYYENGEYFGIIEERNFNATIVNHYVKKHWTKKTYK